jgi:hypothetical protein
VVYVGLQLAHALRHRRRTLQLQLRLRLLEVNDESDKDCNDSAAVIESGSHVQEVPEE